MDELEPFLAAARRALRHPQDRLRAERILLQWASAWQGPDRKLSATFSNHGAFLHFHQLIGSTWSDAFHFRAALGHGLSLRGPDTDRARKSHKLRRHPLDRAGLDALFEDWQAHPEARPAGNAVEFFLEEAPDEVWAACLQEALARLE